MVRIYWPANVLQVYAPSITIKLIKNKQYID